MNDKKLRLYECPICDCEHLGRVDEIVNTRLCETFPTTYGKGRLICDDCLPVRMTVIRSHE